MENQKPFEEDFENSNSFQNNQSLICETNSEHYISEQASTNKDIILQVIKSSLISMMGATMSFVYETINQIFIGHIDPYMLAGVGMGNT